MGYARYNALALPISIPNSRIISRLTFRFHNRHPRVGGGVRLLRMGKHFNSSMDDAAWRGVFGR